MEKPILKSDTQISSKLVTDERYLLNGWMDPIVIEKLLRTTVEDLIQIQSLWQCYPVMAQIPKFGHSWNCWTGKVQILNLIPYHHLVLSLPLPNRLKMTLFLIIPPKYLKDTLPMREIVSKIIPQINYSCWDMLGMVPQWIPKGGWAGEEEEGGVIVKNYGKSAWKVPFQSDSKRASRSPIYVPYMSFDRPMTLRC